MIIVGPSSYQVANEVTANPAAIAANSIGVTNLAVAGAVPGMVFVISAPALETGLGIVHSTCTTAGTVIMRILNATGASIDPASQTFRVVAL